MSTPSKPAVRSHALSGQVATEFMLYVSVFMFVAVAAFVVVNHLQSSEIPLQQNIVVKRVGENLVDIISLSVKGGEGFTYSYSFPKTVFEIPYRAYIAPGGSNSMIIEWEGPYGNFSYSYYLPPYKYLFGDCLLASGGVLESNQCSNVLTLNNDGENLTIIQS